jgi:hypothetical protein
MPEQFSDIAGALYLLLNNDDVFKNELCAASSSITSAKRFFVDTSRCPTLHLLWTVGESTDITVNLRLFNAITDADPFKIILLRNLSTAALLPGPLAIEGDSILLYDQGMPPKIDGFADIEIVNNDAGADAHLWGKVWMK